MGAGILATPLATKCSEPFVPAVIDPVSGEVVTPELKSPSIEMPYEGDYTQQDYALQMIPDYLDT